jgi:flagellin
MALSIISNYAANVAHRNLTATDMRTTDSLAKLSSGSRVVPRTTPPRSRLVRAQAEVECQAGAGQRWPGSMLQIADGARHDFDIRRVRTLATQARLVSLPQERTFLNNEFVALRSEAIVGRTPSSTVRRWLTTFGRHHRHQHRGCGRYRAVPVR